MGGCQTLSITFFSHHHHPTIQPPLSLPPSFVTATVVRHRHRRSSPPPSFITATVVRHRHHRSSPPPSFITATIITATAVHHRHITDDPTATTTSVTPYGPSLRKV